MLLPKSIDPIRVARQGAHLAGKLPLNTCARLQSICDQGELQADVEIELNMDMEARVPFLSGVIEATVNMTCQRCNQPMQYDLKVPFLLSPVVSEKAAKNLPHDYDPLIVTDESVLISDLVEDELLLALPMVPKHEEGECV